MLVPVHSEVITHHSPNPKIRNYTLRQSFKVLQKDGTYKEIFYTDDSGNPISITVGKDFVFDLSKKCDADNYKKLQIQLQLDPELKQHIKILDDNLNIDKAIKFDKIKIRVKNQLLDLYEKENEEYLAKIFRRMYKNTRGLTIGVIYKKLSEVAETEPQKIQEMIDDADFELKALIDQARESRVLDYDGVYKSRDGKILAGNDEEMVYLLKQQPEFKKNLEALLRQTAKVEAITPEIIGRVNEEALALLEELDDSPVVLNGKSIASSDDEDEVNEDFTPELIAETIKEALKENVIKVVAAKGPNAGMVNVPGISQNIPKKTLQAFYENSHPQFKILLEELRAIEIDRLESDELEKTLNNLD